MFLTALLEELAQKMLVFVHFGNYSLHAKEGIRTGTSDRDCDPRTHSKEGGRGDG